MKWIRLFENGLDSCAQDMKDFISFKDSLLAISFETV